MVKKNKFYFQEQSVFLTNYDVNQKIWTKKKKIQKFQLISILCLQVMHDNVHWHCSIDYCIKLILVDENLSENCSYFSLKWFLLNTFGEIYFLQESYK